MKRRVVVTGMGMVTPLGSGVEHNWRRLVAGDSGIRRITHFDTAELTSKVGGPVPRAGLGDAGPGVFDPDAVMHPKLQRRVDDFILLAMGAAAEAIAQSGFPLETEAQRAMAGVMIGSGIGGMQALYQASVDCFTHGPRRISPLFVPSAIINSASAQVAIHHGLKGPNHAVVTACATGSHAIGDAARLIADGDADVMVAGGAESSVNLVVMAAFSGARVLAMDHADEPARASRPFDAARSGFVMGEGAGCLVLEDRDHAIARGARIQGELLGYG